MSGLQKGLLLAAIQVAIVASLGAKLTFDRHRFPRAWARVGSYDPNLPVRGRYMALQLEVLCDAAPAPATAAPGIGPPAQVNDYLRGTLRSQNGRLASDCNSSEGFVLWRRKQPGQPALIVLSEPVLFFLPEYAKDPWEQSRNGELWAEVTVPRSGPPRPIRLAIKRGDAFTPLEIR